MRDRAGERILMECAAHLGELRGAPVRLYKNNTDFRGHSYGCHENYLLPRSLPWTVLAVLGTIGHLVDVHRERDGQGGGVGLDEGLQAQELGLVPVAGQVERAAELGAEVARRLLDQGAREILSRVYGESPPLAGVRILVTRAPAQAGAQ